MVEDSDFVYRDVDTFTVATCKTCGNQTEIDLFVAYDRRECCGQE